MQFSAFYRAKGENPDFPKRETRTVFVNGSKTTVTNVLVLQVLGGITRMAILRTARTACCSNAALFDRFKVWFADACPKTIPEAIHSSCNKICERTERNTQQCVEHLDCTYQKIMSKGEGTNKMDD
jgi:hypothetical protein